MTVWDIAVRVAAVIGGLVLFSALTLGVLLAVDALRGRGAQQPALVPSTNRVTHDRLSFPSVEARSEFEATFWAAVGPIQKFPTPLVPGDGGGARWTS